MTGSLSFDWEAGTTPADYNKLYIRDTTSSSLEEEELEVIDLKSQKKEQTQFYGDLTN